MIIMSRRGNACSHCLCLSFPNLVTISDTMAKNKYIMEYLIAYLCFSEYLKLFIPVLTWVNNFKMNK